MQKQFFRQNSLEKMNKPEELDQCIHVLPPAIWLVLAGVVALLIGVFVWGLFGGIEVEKSYVAYAYTDRVVIFIPSSYSDNSITRESECYIDSIKGPIKIKIEEIGMKTSMKTLLEIEFGTELHDNDVNVFSTLLNQINNYVSVNLDDIDSNDIEPIDYNNIYVAIGRPVSGSLPEGYCDAKVITGLTSMFKLLFS